MTKDEHALLVNSVCDIDKWSKQGSISDEVRDKIQMLCSAFYWLDANSFWNEPRMPPLKFWCPICHQSFSHAAPHYGECYAKNMQGDIVHVGECGEWPSLDGLAADVGVDNDLPDRTLGTIYLGIKRDS